MSESTLNRRSMFMALAGSLAALGGTVALTSSAFARGNGGGGGGPGGGGGGPGSDGGPGGSPALDRAPRTLMSQEFPPDPPSTIPPRRPRPRPQRVRIARRGTLQPGCQIRGRRGVIDQRCLTDATYGS